MLACWAFQPEERPNFSWILQYLQTLKEVDELNSEAPFPPTFHGAVNHAFSKPDSGSGSGGCSSEVQIFTTPGSARFKRNVPTTGSLKPVPKHRRKIPGFRSFRKTRAASSPQPPPSKEQLDRPASSSPRPVSGASSGMESYTTSRLSYEVPLLKNVNDEARRSRQLTSDYVSASSGSVVSGSLQGVHSSISRSLHGADNLAFEPTSPKSEGNMLQLHDYPAQNAGAGSTQNQYAPSPAARKPKRAAPASPFRQDLSTTAEEPAYQSSSLNLPPRNSWTRTSDV